MLTISRKASDAISLALEAASVPEGAGLRLTPGPRSAEGTAVHITFVTEPEPADQVIETGAAAVGPDIGVDLVVQQLDGRGRDEHAVKGADGWPEQSAGVVDSSPGLYFVGLPFLYSFASMLIGGVGRDAGRVAEHIVARAEAEQPAEREAIATAA